MNRELAPWGVSVSICRSLVLLGIFGGIVPQAPSAAETPAAEASHPKHEHSHEVAAPSAPDPLAQPTAIVLNYCRASFHRIQKTPSKRVLLEEQEKILNNLNLNPIADAEIIRLYTAVLSEIADVQIADTEQEVIRTQHRRAVVHDLAISALAIGGQVATTQYVGALKTGAASWWDYRTLVFNRELALWRVDKDRIVAFVDKSSLFLDTFWKLARKRGIPDEWLIRNNDLDQLAAAMAEPRPDVRLRVLKRMERFMECYPPYWYYVARTQQALGQFPEALETYHHLESLGDQYFRKDEMLAAAFANQALLEDHLGRDTAVETAGKALRYSTDVWEVNLMCGVLLLKHGRHADAEDAILRNLDVDLETQQSLVALLAVYHVSADTRKLRERLSKPDIARTIPAPLLLECVGLLGTGNIPQATLAQIFRSLAGDFDRHFGPDDFRLEALPGWQLDRAKLSLSVGGKTAGEPVVSIETDKHKLRFARIAERGTPLQAAAPPVQVVLTVKYPETETMHLHLQELSTRTLKTLTGESETGIRWPLLSNSDYRIVAVDLHGKRVTLTTTPNPLPAPKAEHATPIPVSKPPEVPAPAPAPPNDAHLPLVPAF